MGRAELRLAQCSAARRLLVLISASMFVLYLPHSAASQPVRGRVLEGLSLRSRVGRHELTVRFSVPIRVLRHSPSERGTLLQIAAETDLNAANIGLVGLQQNGVEFV